MASLTERQAFASATREEQGRRQLVLGQITAPTQDQATTLATDHVAETATSKLTFIYPPFRRLDPIKRTQGREISKRRPREQEQTHKLYTIDHE